MLVAKSSNVMEIYDLQNKSPIIMPLQMIIVNNFECIFPYFHYIKLELININMELYW